MLILGCGVAGLTTGVVLAERYHRRVCIVAREHWRQTASGKAGGLWLPYRIEPRERVLGWSRRTFQTLITLSEDPRNGVLLRENVELYRGAVDADSIWWLSAVPEVRRLGRDELPPGYATGFAARVPVMDVPVYMPRLEERFRDAGGQVEITGRAVQSLDDLPVESAVVINCTGMGARELCDDRSMVPVRGQLVRTSNPGLERCVADEHHPLGIAYVIARSGDCILGGTAEEGVEDLTPDRSQRQRVLEVNRSLAPQLGGAEVLDDVVCVRPFRRTVRLEREIRPGGRVVVHNYGHGGAGYTVSWGCAEEAAALACDDEPV